MKICFVSTSIEGGFGSFLYNTTTILLRNNVDVDVLYINNKKNNLDSKVGCFYVDYSYVDTSEDFHKLNFYNALYYFKKALHKFIKIFPSYKSVKLFEIQLDAFYSVRKTKTIIDLSKYDCVISSEEIFANYFLANNIRAKRKIGFVHPDYKDAGFAKTVDRPMFDKLDCICCVSKSNAVSLKSAFKTMRNKIVGLPNLIDTQSVIKKADTGEIGIKYDEDVINIITVCRLDNTSKALDRAAKVALVLKEKGYKFIWRIVGEGYYRSQLENIISNYHINDCFILLGYKENPMPFIKKSDLFVLQSYYEGYPISVCEALILGIPCMVTNFKSAKEMIQEYEDGIIAKNNIKDIVLKMEQLLSNNGREITKIKKKLENKDRCYFENAEHFINVCKGVKHEEDN